MGFMGELDGGACGQFGSRRFPSSPCVFVVALSQCLFVLLRSFGLICSEVRHEVRSFDVTGSRHLPSPTCSVF